MIRPIEEKDLPALFTLRPQTRENPVSVERLTELGITPDSLAAALRDSQRGWLYETDAQVGGFAMGDAANHELTVIALLPEYEGQGIGGQLLSRVEGWLASTGCQQIWLATSLDPALRAYGFYLRNGWRDWKIEDGQRLMRKTVAQSSES
ncbi:MAG: GNAT family N-acetyltransferase [Pseudomonadota bacterium]